MGVVIVCDLTAELATIRRLESYTSHERGGKMYDDTYEWLKTITHPWDK